MKFLIFGSVFAALWLVGCSKVSESTSPSPTYYSYKPKFPRCAGSYEPEKCDAQELALSKEAPSDVEARAKRLDEERRKNMEVVNSGLAVENQQSQPIVGNGWYTFDVNHATCFASQMSPADRIRQIQSEGFRARVNDIEAGAVEVGQDTEKGFAYWTYFKSMDSCIASLPRSKPIPSKYE